MVKNMADFRKHNLGEKAFEYRVYLQQVLHRLKFIRNQTIFYVTTSMSLSVNSEGYFIVLSNFRFQGSRGEPVAARRCRHGVQGIFLMYFPFD